MEKEKIIVWFRNDLRLHDHEPLFRALQKTSAIIPVYCFDNRHFELLAPQFPKTGAFRAKFLLESVANLRKNLRALGSDLIVLKGLPEIEIARIAQETNASAVYASKEATSEEITVESRLEQNLWKQGTPITYFWHSTLYHPEDLPKPISALSDVFTNFRKEVERSATIREPFPLPQNLEPLSVAAGEIPSLQKLGLKNPPIDSRTALHFEGGEEAAKARLHSYLWETDSLKTYKETRNGLLGANYSSKFSAWLALGCLSPRFIYSQVQQYEKQRIKNQSTYWLIFELLWRDYFRFVAKKYGASIFRDSGIKNLSVSFTGKKSLFDKWVNGQTGIPFIDANMIELRQTGFMSNRGRQNVASFLVKDLRLNWTWGARYFESQLIDYDPCSNWCNWNYVAGVGNDPRENRYFNIMSQAERYDPKGDYVKHWLPVLKQVPHQQVHTVGDLLPGQQATYEVRIGTDYPKPVVSYKTWLC